MTSAPTRVGVIGLGDMGMPILGGYVRGGHEVFAFDLRQAALDGAKALGAQPTTDALELAKNSDVVALVVVDDDQLRRVLLGEDGVIAAMAKGSSIVVHSTALPSTVIELAAVAEAGGIGLLDCPVTGGTERAKQGQLTVYVGGDEELFSSLRPVLTSLGTPEYAGPLGAGQIIKLTNNLMHFGNKAFIYQALELARAAGIDERRVRELWRGGSGDSWALEHLDHLDTLLTSHTLSGSPKLFEFMSKDMWSAAVAARALEVHLPLVPMVAESLPGLDAARLARLLERDPDEDP